jgi:hypothetical protein
MNKLLYFVAIFLLLFSCQKSDENGETIPSFNITKTTISFSGELSLKDSFAIESNVNWTVSINPANTTWLQVSSTTGSNNMKIIVATIEKNLSASPRTATITITPSNSSLQSVSIIVTQQPIPGLIVWSKLFGGSLGDESNSIINTPDGGFLIAGHTFSNNGDVVGYHPTSSDVFLVKVDANGNKQWAKTYGGTWGEFSSAVINTPDGGYAMIGYAFSNDGDLSGSNIGGYDIWLLKFDANGNKQWSKNYGGVGSDRGTSVVALPGGGYIIVGYTFSNDGDVSGSHGISDVFVMKLDANGAKVWSKLYGGTNVEEVSSVITTSDGGFAVAGHSFSNNGDVSGNHGNADAWILKIDASGNKQWSKLYGGSMGDFFNSMMQTKDGGYIASGYTMSNDGEISGNHGASDALVVKIDANGNKKWSKLFGGTDNDQANSVITTQDGQYIIAGHTISNDGDITGFKGIADAFVMKLDENGNKQNIKIYGGSAADISDAIVISSDGGYVITGYSSSTDGNLLSSNNHGTTDAWIMKINP